jgi:VanZ family protein
MTELRRINEPKLKLEPSGQRPRWAWLLFPHLAGLSGASLLATWNRLPLAAVSRLGLDKVGHLFAFGGLSFFAVGFFGRARWKVTVLVIAALSALEEASQRYLPARTFDLGDLAANLIGIAVLGLLAARILARARPAAAR